MNARRLIQAATLAGALGVALAFLAVDPERFWANWVLWFVFFLTVGLGALFLVALEHLVNARWSAPIRRVAERLSSLLLLAMPLAVVALAALPTLFHEWTGPEAANHAAVAGKAGWLNVRFFVVRLVLCFAAWLWSYRVLVVGSREQDVTRDPRFNVRARRFAPAFMVLFALTVSLVAFDWISSIQPQWYSDIFPVYVFAGAFMAGLAAVTLGVLSLKARGRLPEVRGDHLFSLGGLMFAFTVFYAYIGFAQYMLMWYADLPEEVFWYKTRISGGWLAVALLLALIHFFVPFFALITRDSKSDPVRLRSVAALVLAAHYLDLYWLVFPALGRGVLFSWPEIAFALLFGGGGLLWLGRAETRGADMPVGDPFLAEALEFRL
jgi:hypothetical protein